ncbi:hypothetical protein F9L33_11220 [Amylibacter sp. SFDW26]|uniref:hypothetical protein n=1 Tax=Amylibacter sp. SFDW26 TaxID=2652722 RepID=UPI0012622D57|nr:hypothetical protein [Amylibacter sp. SFDW26]KAB7613921.1 hypothetical protein F9L33_11220 [Amylibacter sp. SFDW26]
MTESTMRYASIRTCGLFYTTRMFDSLGRIKAQRKELRSFVLFFGFIALLLYILSPARNTDFNLSKGECAELNMLWQSKYQNDFQFDETWSFELFECETAKAKLAHAIFLIDRMTVEPEKFDFYDWMKRVNPIFSQRLMFGYSGISYFEAHQVDINIDKLRTSNPVEIAGVLIHETRHLEQGYNSHIPCSVDEKRQCDLRLEADLLTGGAYSYDTAFYDQLIKDTKSTRSVKYAASKLLQSNLDTKFNEPVANNRFK